MRYAFDYRKLGDFTYHILKDQDLIKNYMMEWIMREWQVDHHEAPEERWTDAWMNILPKMDFTLEVVKLENIILNKDLMSVDNFRASLKERADEREESILRGVSIEPLPVNRNGFELMDGYTRYTVLKRHHQSEVYTYTGTV